MDHSTRAHGEGVQHLGVPVDHLEKSIAEYQKLSYSAWGQQQKYC